MLRYNNNFKQVNTAKSTDGKSFLNPMVETCKYDDTHFEKNF